MSRMTIISSDNWCWRSWSCYVYCTRHMICDCIQIESAIQGANTQKLQGHPAHLHSTDIHQTQCVSNVSKSSERELSHIFFHQTQRTTNAPEGFGRLRQSDKAEGSQKAASWAVTHRLDLVLTLDQQIQQLLGVDGRLAVVGHEPNQSLHEQKRRQQ